mgnify:FL=1
MNIFVNEFDITIQSNIIKKIFFSLSFSLSREFHKNETIYKALKLKNVVNIEEVLEHLDDYQIQQKVNKFKSKIKVRTDKLELLTPDAKAKLKALADSSLNDINFDKYTQLVSFFLPSPPLPQF